MGGGKSLLAANIAINNANVGNKVVYFDTDGSGILSRMRCKTDSRIAIIEVEDTYLSMIDDILHQGVDLIMIDKCQPTRTTNDLIIIAEMCEYWGVKFIATQTTHRSSIENDENIHPNIHNFNHITTSSNAGQLIISVNDARSKFTAPVREPGRIYKNDVIGDMGK